MRRAGLLSLTCLLMMLSLLGCSEPVEDVHRIHRAGWQVVIYGGTKDRHHSLILDYENQWEDLSYVHVPDGPLHGKVWPHYHRVNQVPLEVHQSREIHNVHNGSRHQGERVTYFEAFYYAPGGVKPDSVQEADIEGLINFLQSQE